MFIAKHFTCVLYCKVYTSVEKGMMIICLPKGKLYNMAQKGKRTFYYFITYLLRRKEITTTFNTYSCYEIVLFSLYSVKK